MEGGGEGGEVEGIYVTSALVATQMTGRRWGRSRESVMGFRVKVGFGLWMEEFLVERLSCCW